MTYNPMSKEFQDECKRLGLTGNQLIQKYRDDGKLPCTADINRMKKKVIAKVCCNCECHNTYIDPRGAEQWRKHKCQKMTCTGYLCTSCHSKYRYIRGETTANIQNSLRNCRTGNQNPDHESTKASMSQRLACELYGWKDLNEERDNHAVPVDCYDPKTGLYHQIQGKNSCEDISWSFATEREWVKIFEDMVCFCFSKDGRRVERIYKFPKEEIDKRVGITVTKNPMNTRGTKPILPWYEEYRIKDKDELNSANRIWMKIIDKGC